MARMRVFVVLALAIAAGGTFAFGTYRYMQNVPAQAATCSSARSCDVKICTSSSGRPEAFQPGRS